MAAWGYTTTGSRVLLHLTAGSKEDAEIVTAFFQDMRARGLGDPLRPEFNARIRACYQARSRAIARDLAKASSATTARPAFSDRLLRGRLRARRPVPLDQDHQPP
jgi:hypothetical protein